MNGLTTLSPFPKELEDFLIHSKEYGLGMDRKIASTKKAIDKSLTGLKKRDIVKDKEEDMAKSKAKKCDSKMMKKKK